MGLDSLSALMSRRRGSPFGADRYMECVIIIMFFLFLFLSLFLFYFILGDEEGRGHGLDYLDKGRYLLYS